MQYVFMWCHFLSFEILIDSWRFRLCNVIPRVTDVIPRMEQMPGAFIRSIGIFQ